MATYKYTIKMEYTDPSTSEPVNIWGENIMGLAIEYNYDSEAIQPMCMAKVKLDKNLIDKIVKNKAEGRIQLIINKIDVTNGQGAELPYINTKCTYELQDDMNADKATLYGEDAGQQDAQDVYMQTTLGLISEDIVNMNVVSNDLTIKDCNMMGAICYFLKDIPCVIQPFDHNKEIDQLVIQPVETMKELIKFMADVGTFYDTKIRFFYDWDCAYLTDSSGRGTPKDDEKYNTVILKAVNPDTDAGAFEQGIQELDEEQCYRMSFQTEDNDYKEDNTQDKIFNNIIGVIDPSREGSNASLAGDIMSQAISAVESIANTVTESAKAISEGINSAIEGKHKINHNTSLNEYESDKYKNNSRQAKSACTSAIATFGLQQYDSSLMSKMNNFDMVNSEVDSYMNTNKEGSNNFSEMSDMSADSGRNVTTEFSNCINGVKPPNIVDNINKMKEQVPTNVDNNAKIDDLTAKADDLMKKASTAMDETTTRSIQDIQSVLSALDKVPISSPLPGGGSTPGFPQDMVDEAKSKLQDLKNKIQENKNKMTDQFNKMKDFTEKGVNFAKDLNSTQSSETPEINKLGDIQGKLQGVAQSFSSVMSQVNEVKGKFTSALSNIDNVTREAANNIKGAMQSMQAMADLGIGSLSDLSDITKIGDLSSIGKLGITAIPNVPLDISSDPNAPKRSKFMGTTNDDPNKIKAIQHSKSLNSRTITITKDNVDNSVFTINKEYLVQQSESKDDKGGRHLLKRKQEMYMREGDKFYCNTILDFCKCPDMNFGE